MKAIVSGASKGIGRAISKMLAEEGHDIAMASRGLTELEELKKEIQKDNNVECITKSVDFNSSFETVNFAQSVLHAWDSVDIIVNNVGAYEMGTVSQADDKALERMMKINTYAAFYLTKPFLEGMKKKKSGYIFNICSVVSQKPRTDAAAYTISKFALKGFTDVLRDEMRDYSVKVTAIFPGSVNTPSWDGIDAPKETFVQPQDIADSIRTCLNASPGTLTEEIHLNPLDKNY